MSRDSRVLLVIIGRGLVAFAVLVTVYAGEPFNIATIGGIAGIGLVAWANTIRPPRRGVAAEAHRRLASGLIAALALVGCSDDDTESSRSITTSVRESVTSPADPALSAFAAEADAVCSGMPARFEGLSDPDGDGGLKPIGLGRVVSEVFTELGAVRPPPAHAAAWDEAIGLLVESGRRITESEELAAAGDEVASDEAQSEALWELQPQAHELLARIGAPFEVCFIE
jgi:hypothetical protein